MLHTASRALLLLKVICYNITLLPKKVTNCVTKLHFRESNVLLLLQYFLPPGQGLLIFIYFFFLITKHPKVLFLAIVKALSHYK